MEHRLDRRRPVLRSAAIATGLRPIAQAVAWEESADDRLYAQIQADGGDAVFEAWADLGTELAAGNRTSLVVEPPDGKIPARTVTGQV